VTIVQAIETAGPGGAEQVLLRLCRRQREAGHRVLPLLLRRGWLSESLERDGFEVAWLPMDRPVDRRFLRALCGFVRTSGADVLHSHEITFALYGRACALRTGLAHVATAHGANFSKGAKRKALGALALRSAARFRLVAVSGSLADQIARDFLLGRERVRVVPNGIDLAAGNPCARGRAPGEPLRVVAVGNLYPVKNHALLVRAVARLRREGIQVELDVLGRGGEEAALRRLAGELGVSESVRFQGFRADVIDFLLQAHVFASASLSEAMPLSFLEAMSVGLPVVAPRVGGIPEIVEEGVHGLLFTALDEAGAAGALRVLAQDERLRAALGERAAADARARHAAERMVTRYGELYAEVVAA
jgi:glycosyltransferase involved in cell wall biosynthesis